MGLDDCLDHIWDRAEVYLDSKAQDKKYGSIKAALRSAKSMMACLGSTLRCACCIQEAYATIWQSRQGKIETEAPQQVHRTRQALIPHLWMRTNMQAVAGVSAESGCTCSRTSSSSSPF